MGLGWILVKALLEFFVTRVDRALATVEERQDKNYLDKLQNCLIQFSFY